jgi:hypothetical protein
MQFVSDGVSTAFSTDLSLAPVSLALRGLGAVSVLVPSVSSVLGPGPTVTVAVVGSIATFTFSAPMAQSSGGVVIPYTLSFLIQL